MQELDDTREVEGFLADGFDGEKIAKSLDEFLTRTNPQYLILGEEHHQTLQNIAILSDPHVQNVLQKHGFNDIALEARQEFQKSVDAIANGTLSPAKLADEAVDWYKSQGDDGAELARGSYEARGELIQQSHARGLSIHFVENESDYIRYFKQDGKKDALFQNDVVPKLPSAETYVDEAKTKLMDAFEKAGGNPDEATQQKMFLNIEDQVSREKSRDTYIGIKNNSELSSLEQGQIESRQAHDPVAVENILAATSDRKTVILYGSAHGEGMKDMDELLPNSVRLRLSANRADMIDCAQRIDVNGAEQPDAYLNVNLGTILSADKVMSLGAPEAAPTSVTVAPKQAPSLAPVP